MRIVVTGRTPELAAPIHAIAGTQHAINVGVKVDGNKQSDTFGVIG